MLPTFQPDIAPEMRAEIEAKLAGIVQDHGVRILFAIESGSRAWGFPSPDSDYDVRFLYAHPPDWYLSLTPGRDVIELPIRGELDINGWDIRKALNLLLKPNPVLLEWLSSPIRYRWNEGVTARLTALAERTAHGGACLYHYRHLGGEQWRRHIEGRDEVNIKKYFYALRPALAIRWVERQPEILPPMNLQDLVAGLALDRDFLRDIEILLERKAKAREVGLGPRIESLDRFITGAFEWAKTIAPRTERPDLRVEATDLFRAIIKDDGR